MGLASSPSSFQLLVDKVLRGLTFRSCLCYLDDVVIFSETFDSHISDLQEVLSRLKSAGLKLNPEKCRFSEQSCIYLGHHISRDGIRPPPDRLTALQDYPQPKNVQQLRRAMGLFNWFRKFIPNYSAEAEPLYRLLKKSFVFKWTDEQDHAFKRLKELLLNSEVLAFPQFNIPFYLAVDTSSRGLGYVLYQKHPDENGDLNKVRVVRFGSKSLNNWQRSYGPTKLELLGLVTSIVDCSSYLRGSRFVVECDHQALRPLFQKQFKGAIYERWLAILQQYNFEIQYKPASQMQAPDALSRCKEDNVDGNTSPDETDPYFPYVTEEVGDIRLPEGLPLSDLLGRNNQSVNAVSTLTKDIDSGYLADTEENSKKPIMASGSVYGANSSSTNENNSIVCSAEKDPLISDSALTSRLEYLESIFCDTTYIGANSSSKNLLSSWLQPISQTESKSDDRPIKCAVNNGDDCNSKFNINCFQPSHDDNISLFCPTSGNGVDCNSKLSTCFVPLPQNNGEISNN